jgi:YidC/Oxa1 family membrane protein insertase
MPNLRPVLLISLLFLGYLMWLEWQKDYGPQPPAAQATGTAAVDAPAAPVTDGGDLPDLDSLAQGDVPAVTASPTPDAPEIAAAPAAVIRVTTDVLDVAIDPVGGTMVDAKLLAYPVTLDAPEQKVQLFNAGPGRFHVAQSGLLSTGEAPNHTTSFLAAADQFVLADGEDRLEVPLTWRGANGLEVRKTYVFERGEYAVSLEQVVRNAGDAPWSGSQYLQLQKSPPGDEGGAGFNNPERYSFDGIGFYSPEEKLEKLDFEDALDDPFRSATTQGWSAMIQHYFFSAWVPEPEPTYTYSTEVYQPTGTQRVIARALSPQVAIAPGQEHAFRSTLYVGPKIQDQLADIAPGLDLTVNYGIFTVFSAPLFWLLSKIHDVVGNWGWAIVILTILIKLAFFKLTEAQYRSMARMRKLQPRIETLKERYGDDRQALSQAMMKMYKEEKVNPLGGCLPILVQIPIFIALYWVLLESVELRQAPFILWIDNLSVRDPYFILPILNAVFMIATQRLTPMVGMDPLQQKMMQAMPIVFAVMFAFFPAGLVLYWATNAGLSLAQQWYITRKITAES